MQFDLNNYIKIQNVKIVNEDINKDIHSGQSTIIALSKTVQTALGQPYSDCNEAKDYRQTSNVLNSLTLYL